MFSRKFVLFVCQRKLMKIFAHIVNFNIKDLSWELITILLIFANYRYFVLARKLCPVYYIYMTQTQKPKVCLIIRQKFGLVN